MFAPGARLGVGVSGGADSVALLHVLHSLDAEWNLKLTVLHLNHGLRGSDSDADEQFVRDLAATLKLPVHVDRATLAGHPGNLEQLAREARRSFFRTSMARFKLDRTATAHTRSDQAETVLFRLLRGTYTTGLAAIRPVTGEGIVRPFLDISRPQIEDYLRSRNLPWRDDASNANRAFARNRIRHDLLPQLTAEWNPNLESSLATHARLAQDDERYWEQQTAGYIPAGPEFVLDTAALNPLPVSLQRRIYRCALRQVKGDLRQIDFHHLEQILTLARNTAGHGRLQVPGVDILRSFEWLRFAEPGIKPSSSAVEFFIAGPPAVVPWPPGTSVVLELQDASSPRDTLAGVGLDWKRIESRASEGLVVRNWRPGDRYQQAGRSHEDKLKSLFQEFRIPLWERHLWPMLCLGSQILWSRRFGAAAGFQASQSSPTILWISERKQGGQ